MSSVLKALKKLEEERRGNSAGPGPGNGQRWSSGGQPPRRSRSWLPVIAVLAAGLLVVLVLLWPESGEPPVVAQTTQAETATPAPPQPPVAAAPAVIPAPALPAAGGGNPAPAQTGRPVMEKPVAVVPTVSSRPAVKAPEPLAVAAPIPSPSRQDVGTEQPSRPKLLSPPVREPVPVPRVETPVRQVQVNRFDIPSPGQEWVAPPQLTVSEILPPTGGERMAIVNGLPVMVGTMVEGAMVEEIHDDRVVISIDGKQASLPVRKGR